MAPPDLNSVPPSPHNNNATTTTTTHSPLAPSRRGSHMTGTPLLPSVTSSGFYQQTDDLNAPMRHPRPLTAAELHLELEKEGEAVVNRLSRELSSLRQQSVSVVSNASSSNTSAIDHPPHASSEFQVPPHPGRRDRSSSTVSTRSIQGHLPLGASTSQASVERARDAAGMRSRENSLAGVGMPLPSRSRAPSASPSPHLTALGVESSQLLASGRYDDMERARAALELAKKENDMLAARVRELEVQLREKNEAIRTQGRNGSDGAASAA